MAWDTPPGIEGWPLGSRQKPALLLYPYFPFHCSSYPEIGRVERTLFTLDWIESPEERRRATRELNKGEAQNALKRAIFFHRAGRIRDPSLQAQGYRASALNLVASAIVLWNTTYLEAAMRHLERQRRPVPPDLLQHLSPLGWQHINLTGDYLWSDTRIPKGKLRPLRLSNP